MTHTVGIKPYVKAMPILGMVAYPMTWRVDMRVQISEVVADFKDQEVAHED